MATQESIGKAGELVPLSNEEAAKEILASSVLGLWELPFEQDVNSFVTEADGPAIIQAIREHHGEWKRRQGGADTAGGERTP